MPFLHRVSTKRAVLALVCGLVSLIVCETATVTAQDAANDRKRWAIVPTESEGQGLADLLTVELSTWENVELLERDRIQSVLAELQLNASGLAIADRATRFGQLTQADALALIDVPAEDNESKAVRLRLVDTRTSIRLLDMLLPSGKLDAEVAALRDELRSASAKLEVPPEQLRLIGLVPISSGEPGDFLKPFCRNLTRLVEVGLNQNPQFVVVERSELKRLTAESDLSGLPLEIRASSRLLEASIRRADDGAGMLATCRLISGGGETQDFDLTVASRELVDMRQQIIAAVAQAIGVGVGKRPLSLAAEAEVFDRRAALVRSAYRKKEAADLAEAALALAPSPERLSTALGDYYYIAKNNENLHEGLEAAVRYQELRVEWWAKTKPDDPMRCPHANQEFFFLREVTIPWGRFLVPGDQPLIDELFALSSRFFDLRYAEAGDAASRLALLRQKLGYLIRLKLTPEEYSAAVAAVIGKMQSIIDAEAIPEDTDDVDYADYTLLLLAAEDVNYGVIRLGGRRGRLSSFEDLAIQLGHDDELAVQLAQMCGRARYIDDPETALRLLARLDEWPPAMPGPNSAYFGSSPEAMSRARATLSLRFYFYGLRRLLLKLHPEILAPYLDSVLRHAEEVQDATQLVQLSWVFTPALTIGGEQANDLAVRILAAIDNLPHSANVSDVARLRSFAERHIRPEPHPVFAFENRQGAWQQYSRMPIRLENVSRYRSLHSVFVNTRADAIREGGQLVLVWQQDGGLSLERIGLSGGTPKKLGPDFPGGHRSFRGIQVAVGPDAIFVASVKDGFTMLQEGSYQVFTEKEGAPSNDVFSLAWLKDRLFLGCRDAFASFDPKTKTFQLLASGTSFEPRNVMDGRGSFFVNSMFADETHDCLWLKVQENASGGGRSGVWKFQPGRNSYKKIEQARGELSRTDGGLLLHQYDWYLGHLDVETPAVTEFTGDYSRVPSTVWTGPPPILVGEHIISRAGTLHTPDGQVSRLEPEGEWRLLQRVEPGFVTHYDNKSQTLWYYQPNSDGDDE